MIVLSKDQIDLALKHLAHVFGQASLENRADPGFLPSYVLTVQSPNNGVAGVPVILATLIFEFYHVREQNVFWLADLVQVGEVVSHEITGILEKLQNND